MKQKGYKVRPHFVDYYGAISNAIDRENADAATLTEYLTVAGQVIENESLTKGGIFFRKVRQFFEYHALHVDRSYKLLAFDDAYHFDYVKVEVMPSLLDNFDSAPVDNFDNNQNDNFDQNQFDQWDNQDTQEDFSWDDVPVDTVMPPAMPIWMQPAPQPVLTGPLIRFDKVTLNFSTRYDSAFLTNTKGTLSLTDNTFVGEGGRFDWSPAGLGADSVFFDLAEYNFNVSRPKGRAW